MGLFSKGSGALSDDRSLITFYAEEDNLHPQIKAAFDWYNDFLLKNIEQTYRDNQVVLAGGALRSFFTQTPVRDYDLYVTPDVSNKFKTNSVSDILVGYQWSLISETTLSWLYRKLEYDEKNQQLTNIDINLIKKPYITLDDVINNFDYTVCMCAISNSTIVYHPDYFTDLATRQLRVNNPSDPLSSLWRMQKYIKLGYSINREDLWSLTEEIHEADLPRLVKTQEEKQKISLKENVKTLNEVFRSS